MSSQKIVIAEIANSCGIIRMYVNTN